MLVKLEWLGYRIVKNYDDMLSRFHLVSERKGQTDWRTDGQTDLLYQYRASVCWRAIKTGSRQWRAEAEAHWHLVPYFSGHHRQGHWPVAYTTAVAYTKAKERHFEYPLWRWSSHTTSSFQTHFKHIKTGSFQSHSQYCLFVVVVVVTGGRTRRVAWRYFA